MARCYRFNGSVAPEGLRQGIRKAFPGLLVQTVDSAAASNEKLFEMLGEQTLEASRGGGTLAKKPEVDLLLRLGGTAQISRALQEVGTKHGRSFVLVVIGEEADVRGLESAEGSGWERLQRRELDREEMRRIERAALLDAERA